MATLRMPISARERIIPIKKTNDSEHITIVLTIIKDKPNFKSNRQALEIYKCHQTPRITTALIEQVKAIQNENGHPLVKLLEHDLYITWYAMSPVRGSSAGRERDGGGCRY
jgi:hypothetical protein